MPVEKQRIKQRVVEGGRTIEVTLEEVSRVELTVFDDAKEEIRKQIDVHRRKFAEMISAAGPLNHIEFDDEAFLTSLVTALHAKGLLRDI